MFTISMIFGYGYGHNFCKARCSEIEDKAIAGKLDLSCQNIRCFSSLDFCPKSVCQNCCQHNSYHFAAKLVGCHSTTKCHRASFSSLGSPPGLEAAKDLPASGSPHPLSVLGVGKFSSQQGIHDPMPSCAEREAHGRPNHQGSMAHLNHQSIGNSSGPVTIFLCAQLS